MTALLLDRVCKARGSDRHAVKALRDVSLAVSPGELVLLQGPSGAGKTTRLALAAGLLSADTGRIILAGVAVETQMLAAADEPTGNLDGASGRVVGEGLAYCARSRGAAVLVATHDSRLEPYATRRVHMVDG